MNSSGTTRPTFSPDVPNHADRLHTEAAPAERVRDLEVENAALREELARLVQTNAEALERSRFVQLIADRLPAMMAYWDHDQRCRFANGAYKDWFGITPEALRGKTMKQLLGEKLHRMNEPYILGALRDGKLQEFERTLHTPAGETRHSHALYIPDIFEGRVRGMFVLVTDVTKLKQVETALAEANARLRREAVTDHLTGLYNRRYFTEHSQEAFSRFIRLGQPYALLLMDLDHFKSINDRFGHDAGDKALRAVADALARLTRADIEEPARIGGEEFAVLCYGDIRPATVTTLAERLRTSIAAVAVGEVRLSVSIGGAISDEQDESWEAVYRRADAALYAAKQAGRNRVSLS